MSATISDPFLLSSYALPSQLPLTYGGSSSQRSHHVQLTHNSAKSDGFVTVAVQGDGVHVLDLSALHPAISYMLGPSSSFNCPPVTLTSNINGTKTCITYVAVHSSPDVRPEDRGRTVWMWEETLEDGVTSAEAQKERKSAVISHPVKHIYVPDDLADHVVLVGPQGELTVTDTQLAVLSSSSPSNSSEGDVELLKHAVIPRASCTFVPSRTVPTGGVVSVSVVRDQESARVFVYVVDTEGAFHSAGDCPIPLDKSDKDIVDVSCSAAGHLSVLTRVGTWHSFQLESPNNTTLSLRTQTDPIRLKSLSFISTLSPSAYPSAFEISLAALNTSHVLLAGVSATGSPELVLLLWDMQYSVLLTSHTLAIPSTLARTKRHGISIELIVSTSHGSAQAFLVLSPGPNVSERGNSTAGARTTVLVVPFNVPAVSTIANAIGRASAGAAWVASFKPTKNKPLTKMVDPAQARAIKAMQAASDQKRTDNVEEAFFTWVREEEARLAQVQARTRGEETKLKPALGHLFVTRVLEYVFRRPEGYIPRILRYLLERHAVSSVMVEGGLFSALIARADWQSAMLALQTVSDIPEDDVITLLSKVVASHQASASAVEDAMQVDSIDSASMPALRVYLALCTTYSTSAAALRVALRKHLPDATDLVPVLEVLDSWLEQWNTEEVRFLPDRVNKDAHGVPIPLYTARERADLPPQDKILAFLQTLLDASFIALLAHPPAHKVLRTFLVRLQPELALLGEIEQLRGPLQPFAAAHARVVYEGAHGPLKTDTRIDWRRRKKLAHEQAELTLGLYQVEELVI